MSACEKCWSAAGGDAERYISILRERDRLGLVCTPEERAGSGATMCPVCGRRTRHQLSGFCMVVACMGIRPHLPNPSLWLRKPEHKGWGWLCVVEGTVDHPVQAYRYSPTGPWKTTVGEWQPDWRWLALETPEPPDVTP